VVLTTTKLFGNGEEKSSPLKTMKITLLRNTRVDGELATAGSSVEVDEKDGHYLISNGLAEEAKKSKAKKDTDRSVKDVETR